MVLNYHVDAAKNKSCIATIPGKLYFALDAISFMCLGGKKIKEKNEKQN